MQSTEVISVNLWQILISLCNLLILFWMLKKFLYAPVKKMLQKRQNDIEETYSAAKQAKAQAQKDQADWEERLSSAGREAEQILSAAAAKADRRGNAIVADAQAQAQEIVERAKAQAQLERRKAEAEMKEEIINVSAALTQKVIEREVTGEDRQRLFEAFLDELGDGDDGNK